MKNLLPTEGKKETLTVKDSAYFINTRNGSREELREGAGKTRLILMALHPSGHVIQCLQESGLQDCGVAVWVIGAVDSGGIFHWNSLCMSAAWEARRLIYLVYLL